jgi:hypothetical protein|tara:strand:- start:147 stop:398 length:252 start_codon:yes stop_codon:yes gene_type:complete
MTKPILGQQLTSTFSPDGTGDPVVPSASEQAKSTLHDITSADNIPPLPYKGPAPLKFQNPLVDSLLNGESSLTRVKYIDNLPR